MEYYLAVIKKYAVFRGRADRTEYWTFACFNALFGIAASLLDSVFKMPAYRGIDLVNFLVPSFGKITGVFLPLYFLFMLMPFLAVTARRLHDTGTSGWWCLLGALPIIGTIALIIPLTTAGSQDANMYGPAPAERIPAYLLQQRDFD